jgi:hypothetical protein
VAVARTTNCQPAARESGVDFHHENVPALYGFPLERVNQQTGCTKAGLDTLEQGIVTRGILKKGWRRMPENQVSHFGWKGFSGFLRRQPVRRA